MAITSLDELASALQDANLDLDALSKRPDYETSRIRALRAAKQLCQDLETPLELSRRMGWQEPAHVASIQIALDLGLFSQLKECGPKNSFSTHDLAKTAGVDEELVRRIMRHLASWGTSRETGVNRYSSNAKSDALLDPKVSSGIGIWLNLASMAFRSLPYHLKEQNYVNLADGVWQRALGTDKDFWGWLQANPESSKIFADHISALTDGRTKWTAMYPVKERLIQGAKDSGPLLVDVGGGVGQDVAIFQKEHPQPAGRLFMQDVPERATQARKILDPAIEAEAHDFLTPQPILGSRAYMLHYILHDWPDNMALKILENLKPAMEKDYSRLLIVEFVVAAENADPFNTALDLVMMSYYGAKERTEEDWNSLVEQAGMRIVKIWSLPGDHESVIEVECV